MLRLVPTVAVGVGVVVVRVTQPTALTRFGVAAVVVVVVVVVVAIVVVVVVVVILGLERGHCVAVTAL